MLTTLADVEKGDLLHCEILPAYIQTARYTTSGICCETYEYDINNVLLVPIVLRCVLYLLRL